MAGQRRLYCELSSWWWGCKPGARGLCFLLERAICSVQLLRLSGFMLWQSAFSEYYFCEAYWPAFRRIDFLRAIRSYAQRQRRRGR